MIKYILITQTNHTIYTLTITDMATKKDDKKKDIKEIKETKIKEPISDIIPNLVLDNDIVPDDEDEDMIIETKKKEISQTGFDKLVVELKDLETLSLPDVNERIKEAREYGDLSENAEYNSALNEKQMLETRISELKEIIANSIVVDASKKWNTVQYGSTVTFEVKEWEETYTVTIVGTAEIAFEEELKHISLDSPIGLAIEGKKTGDVCKVRSERGRFELKITNIS